MSQFAKVYKNKYRKQCNSPACKTWVEVGAGFIQNINGRWVTWCKQCVPVRIGAQQPTVKPRLTEDGKMFFPYSPEAKDLVKSLPGPNGFRNAKYCPPDQGGPCWHVSTDLADRRRVLEVANKLNMEIPGSLQYIPERKEVKVAEDIGLYPFQVEGVQWMTYRDKALLGDDMGLGKTVQTIMSWPENGKIVVVCPASLQYNWKDEVKHWRPSFRATVLRGRNSWKWPEEGEVVISNYGILPTDFDPPTRPRRQPWATYKQKLFDFRDKLRDANQDADDVVLVYDEVHKLKNFKTKCSMRGRELVNLVTSRGGKIWGLTGTPFDNRPADLYGVLSSMEMAYDTFGSWDRYKQLFNCTENRWGTQWGSPQPIVPELLRRVMLRRRKDEVLLDLPTKTYKNLVVDDVTRDIKKRLDELEEEWGDYITIEKKLPPFEMFSELRAKLAANRISAMEEYVENCEDQDVPLVVFSAHLAPIDALLKRDGWACITGDTPPQRRQEIVRAFQAGELKGVGLTIRAGGVGLTLTRAWKVLFVDMDWVPASNWQAEDRVCRLTQKANKCEIVRMVSSHILDQHVLKLLAWKIDMIQGAVEGTIEVPASKSEPVVQPAEESEEEFRARMDLMQQAVADHERMEEARREGDQKVIGKSRVIEIHDKQKRRSKRDILPLTENRIQAVKDAFIFMQGVCDGALRRDHQGFNKPDACLAQYLAWAGLENNQELEAAYYMLTRYHRQLSAQWPILFRKEKGE